MPGPAALPPVLSVVVILLSLGFASRAQSIDSDPARLVVVLYPEASDGSPGNALVDRGIRSAFEGNLGGKVEIHNEYLNVSLHPNADYQQDLARFLHRKYGGRKVDLVIVGLSSGLNFALTHRNELFPNVPIVFCAVDKKEVEARQLPADVIGIPIDMNLAASLDLALRTLPNTRRVFVIVGRSQFDTYWEAEARRTFRDLASRAEIEYLAGLPMASLLQKVENLPDHSLIYYLHVFEDGDGRVHMPADVLSRIAAKANSPIFSHVDSYVGRGIVGGRVFSFESAGQQAAQVGLRVLAGESPEQIGIQKTSDNACKFDWRQLRRWGISEANLPSDSIVRFKELSLWDRFRWQIAAVIAVCVLQALLITGLIAQGYRRERAERRLRDSQGQLQELTGRLFGAQESERRRIARELHDDFGQTLALLSVELDLLKQKSPQASAQSSPRIDAMSERVKQLSSSIHDLSHQLHPMKLEQLGFVAAVRGLCKELGQSHSLCIEFINNELPQPLPGDIALCLYRIAQEGLQNVIRHSQAKSAVVKLQALDDSICLSIRDDGIGFDPGSAAERAGLGLASMRERVRLVGGQITIDAQPLRGTQIDVCVPLPQAGQS